MQEPVDAARDRSLWMPHETVHYQTRAWQEQDARDTLGPRVPHEEPMDAPRDRRQALLTSSSRITMDTQRDLYRGECLRRVSNISCIEGSACVGYRISRVSRGVLASGIEYLPVGRELSGRILQPL